MSDGKRCYTCKAIKARSEFSRSVREHDGLQGECKRCNKVRWDLARTRRALKKTAEPDAERRDTERRALKKAAERDPVRTEERRALRATLHTLLSPLFKATP